MSMTEECCFKGVIHIVKYEKLSLTCLQVHFCRMIDHSKKDCLPTRVHAILLRKHHRSVALYVLITKHLV